MLQTRCAREKGNIPLQAQELEAKKNKEDKANAYSVCGTFQGLIILEQAESPSWEVDRDG